MKKNTISIYIGLFCLSFILIGCVAKSKYTEMSQKADRLEEDLQSTEAKLQSLKSEVQSTEKNLSDLRDQKTNQDRLVASLKSELQAGDAKISRLNDRLSLNLVDSIVFQSGSANLSSKGKETLNKVASVLKDTKNKKILVYGHTDKVPIGSGIKNKFETNWELSTARATSVVRYLAERSVPESRMMAAGRAQYEPIASNDSAEGRRQNRRIEIVLVPQEIKMKR